MLDSFPVCVLVGTVLGFLSGLGVGGGSLLILWLTLVLGMEQADARILNLLFFLPSAATATFFRRKQGVFRFSDVLPAMIAGCIAAGALSFVGQKMDLSVLKKLFGGLLLFTGLRELLYKPGKS